MDTRTRKVLDRLPGETVTVPAATLRELAEKLTAENAVKVRAQLIELRGSMQAG